MPKSPLPSVKGASAVRIDAMTERFAVRTPSNATEGRARGGFTLTEMLVVIGIIALLLGILLPALSAVQERARKTTTENLLTEFGKACETFQQQFGFYPGLVPEAILANSATPAISGTENALLHLCGGGISQDDPRYNDPVYNGWTVVNFNVPGGGTFSIKVNAAKVGEGPRIRGVQYKPFFTPDADKLAPVPGQFLTAANADPFANDPLRLPDLVDAWGQPVIYMRQMRPQGSTLVAGATPAESMTDCMFAYQPIRPYTASVELGNLSQSQAGHSILALAANQSATLAQIIRNVSYGAPNAPLAGAPRGAWVLISAGRDGIFFSRTDGLGNPTAPVTDIINPPTGPYVVNQYDDVRVFGGG
jgi:prepilin-type N-terminal cleavage/methylation domain-containing protein